MPAAVFGVVGLGRPAVLVPLDDALALGDALLAGTVPIDAEARGGVEAPDAAAMIAGDPAGVRDVLRFLGRRASGNERQDGSDDRSPGTPHDQPPARRRVGAMPSARV